MAIGKRSFLNEKHKIVVKLMTLSCRIFKRQTPQLTAYQSFQLSLYFPGFLFYLNTIFLFKEITSFICRKHKVGQTITTYNF